MSTWRDSGRHRQSQLAALGALAERAQRRMGNRRNCSAQITGHDLLAVGQCPRCGHALSQLVMSQLAGPALDQREVLMLMGAPARSAGDCLPGIEVGEGTSPDGAPRCRAITEKPGPRRSAR
jgi:hypothetical protein